MGLPEMAATAGLEGPEAIMEMAAQGDKAREYGVLKGLQIQRNPELRELPATRGMLAERDRLAILLPYIIQRILFWLILVP